MLPIVKRVATMAISDANKMLMLESEGAVETLVTGLLLASPRRSEAGADAVQEACAGLLLSLALCRGVGRGAAGRRGGDGGAAGLQQGQAGTEASRAECGERAVRAGGGRQAQVVSTARRQRRWQGWGGAKHVMVSYCWAQQAVVKRVHAALVKRGYSVWIDIEQMRGRRWTSMALAVENAEVMLIGVSREYKESTNCRLEAQYAMQREVPTVPLMLADGYRADGWLGMLIGTRMWYGFFGAVLSEEGLFEGKVSELCRDLGERGQGQCRWLWAAGRMWGRQRPRAAAAGVAAECDDDACDRGAAVGAARD